jgi:hypothetical protein
MDGVGVTANVENISLTDWLAGREGDSPLALHPDHGEPGVALSREA